EFGEVRDQAGNPPNDPDTHEKPEEFPPRYWEFTPLRNNCHTTGRYSDHEHAAAPRRDRGRHRRLAPRRSGAVRREVAAAGRVPRAPRPKVGRLAPLGTDPRRRPGRHRPRARRTA